MGVEKIALIPGMFDPVTNGHLDIIIRAAKLFDKIYVVSFENSAKKTMFDLNERREMLRLGCGGIEGNEKITTDATSELLADYAKSKKINVLIKGVRNIIDYEYEYMLFNINRNISGGMETLFIPSKPEYLYISSMFVREMIAYKRDISDYVPDKVSDFIAGLMRDKTGSGDM